MILLRTSINDFNINKLCIHKAIWNLMLFTLALLLYIWILDLLIYFDWNCMYFSMYFRKKRHFYVNIDISFQLADFHYDSFTVLNKTQSCRNIDMHVLIYQLCDYSAEWCFLFQFVVEILDENSDINVYFSYIFEFSCSYKCSEHKAHRDIYFEKCQNAFFSLNQLKWKVSKERHCSLHNIVSDYNYYLSKQELKRDKLDRIYKPSMQAWAAKSLNATLKILIDIWNYFYSNFSFVRAILQSQILLIRFFFLDFFDFLTIYESCWK